MKKRDKYLIATIISITLFTGIVLFLNANDHEVSPELIVMFGTFWSVEIWQLARIKINKEKNNEEEINE